MIVYGENDSFQVKVEGDRAILEKLVIENGRPVGFEKMIDTTVDHTEELIGIANALVIMRIALSNIRSSTSHLALQHTHPQHYREMLEYAQRASSEALIELDL